MAPQPRRRPAPATRARSRSGWHSRDTSEAAAGSTTSADPVMALQQSVGNQAVSRLFAQRDPSPGAAAPPAAPSGGAPAATATAVTRTSRDDVDAAVLSIYMALNIGGMSTGDVETVLRSLLLQRDRTPALRTRYEERYGRSLESDLRNLSPADQLRSQQYMQQGSLSAVAKLLLAMDGAGTSEEVLWRVLPDAFREGDPAGRWTALVDSPLEITSSWRGKSLDAAFAEELSGNDLDKARALVRFGQLRAIDKIRIATNQAGTDLPLLFDGLRSANPATVRADYEAEYHESLDAVLFDQQDDEGNVISSGDLSGGDADRARALLASSGQPAARLENIVRAAISGSNDTELLFSTVETTITQAAGNGPEARMAQAQLDVLRAQIPRTDDADDPLGLTGLGGISAGELARLKAMLGIAETSTDTTGGYGVTLETLNDPKVRRLRALGGVDLGSVSESLRKAKPEDIELLRAGFNDDHSPLHSYLWQTVTVSSGEWTELSTIFNGTLWQRLQMCAGGMRDDYEDYAYNLLDSFAGPAEKEELRVALRAHDRGGAWPATQAGRALAALDGAFSSAEMTQVRNKIRGGSDGAGADLVAAAEDFEADVRNEQSWWFSTTADLDDERRQLATDTQLAGLDGSLSADEAERLRSDHERGRASLDAYAQLRDEITGYVSQVVQLAAGALATVATGGAAGPAVAAALVRAAVASAIARVVSEKALRGDRFDLVGADGVRAFTAGAVDGVMNVISAGAAGSVLEGITRQQVAHALENGTASLGLRLANSALEGGMGGSVGGMVDAVTNEETWKGGAGSGLLVVLNSTATSTVQGAVMSVGMTAAGAGYSSLRERMAARGGSGTTADAVTTESPTAGHAEGHEAVAPQPHQTDEDGVVSAAEMPDPHTAAPHADAPATEHAGLSDAHPYVAIARGGEDAGCIAVLQRLGRWEVAIRHLQNRTGPAAHLSETASTELIDALVAHRRRIRDHLSAKFEAHPQPRSSDESGSDMDLNVGGESAGHNLIEARRWLDESHPGWEAQYRMALMIDASRVQTVEGALAALSTADQSVIRSRVTREAELLSYSRQVRNAEPAERAALLDRIADSAERTKVEQLADLDKASRSRMADEAMIEGDRLMRRLNTEELSPAERASIAEDVTRQQMLANALGDDAYISPGGVRGFAQNLRLRTPTEHYQAAVDQVDMLLHQIHENHGALEAMRRYEIYKYIMRLCDTLESAGISDPNITFLRDYSELNYRVDRAASSETSRTITRGGLAKSASEARVRYSDLGASLADGGEVTHRVGGVSDSLLRNVYDSLRETVDTHLPTLRERALRGDGGTGPGASLFSLPPMEAARPTESVSAAGTTETGTTSHAAESGTTSHATGGTTAPSADLGRPTGLSSEDALVRVSDAVDRVSQSLPANATIHAHVDAVFQVIVQELGASGAPRPTLIVRDLGNPNSYGSFNRLTNTITVNSGARVPGTSRLAFDVHSDPAAYQRILNTVYHESRHAEQIFRATQLEVEQWVTRNNLQDDPAAWAAAASGIADARRVHPDIARLAAEQRLPAGDSPERALAQEINAELWGDADRSRARSRAQGASGRLRPLIEEAQLALTAAELRLLNAPRDARLVQEVQDLRSRLTRLHTELRNSYNAYRSLFEERDAWNTGERAAAYLARRQEARAGYDRALVAEQRAQEMLEIVRRLAPHEESRALEGVAEAEQAAREALDRLIAMVPDQPLAVSSETTADAP